MARTLGHLWGRAQRYVNGVKADIERDMAVEEFRQLQQKVQAEASAAEQSVKDMALTADQQMNQIEEEMAQLSSSPQETQPSQTKHQPSTGAAPSLVLPAENPK